jgi:hypothetical protein
MEQRGPIGPDFDWLAPMMTQGCESDLGTRTGWFPTTRDGPTRDDQDGSSDSKVAEVRSCGAFCGARIRPLSTSFRCRQSIRLDLVPEPLVLQSAADPCMGHQVEEAITAASTI